MSILDALEAHRETCTTCSPWAVCRVAAALLSQLAIRVAPGPAVFDLEQHRAKCEACRPEKLCDEASDAVKSAGVRRAIPS